jgi:hypothetical protein
VSSGPCPATGIVIYLVVKDHPRPSPWLLPRFIERFESFGIRADLSRSRRPASFAGPQVWAPEMKKAAEVDFTWAACARTYEIRVLAIASLAKGGGLENLAQRHL